MSRENVELVRSAFDAWNAGDVDGVAKLMTPEAEFLPLRSQLEGGQYRGPEGMHQFARDAAEEWEFLRISADEFRDVGDRVLMLGHFNARGRASGVDVRFPVGMIARVRDGKIVHLRTYSDARDALEAVGHSE